MPLEGESVIKSFIMLSWNLSIISTSGTAPPKSKLSFTEKIARWVPLRNIPQFIPVFGLVKNSMSGFWICSRRCVCVSFQFLYVSFSSCGSQCVWFYRIGFINELPLTSLRVSPIWPHSAEFSFAIISSKIQSLKVSCESHWPLNRLGRLLKMQILGFLSDLLKPSLWG